MTPEANMEVTTEELLNDAIRLKRKRKVISFAFPSYDSNYNFTISKKKVHLYQNGNRLQLFLKYIKLVQHR